MNIRLLYFASVRETLGTAGETVTLADSAATVQTLADILAARGGAWEQLLRGDSPLKFAVNHQFAARDTALTDDCEVAIFPPVTGG